MGMFCVWCEIGVKCLPFHRTLWRSVPHQKPDSQSRLRLNAQNEPDQTPPVEYNKTFGYSRKDVIIICAGLGGVGFAMYYGLQAVGVDAIVAGTWVQLIIFLGLCIGWVFTYFFRVATKVGTLTVGV